MDFSIPREIQAKLAELDAFIEKEIAPLEREHPQYFDHRRENARTNWDADGTPRREWEELLAEMRRRADRAGHLRFALPKELGGQGGSNLAMAIIREHLARKGLGLHNDLQNESSIVGNFPQVHMIHRYGSAAQKAELLEGMITGTQRVAFGLTEPDHGSDATWLETRAVRDGHAWVIDGEKRFNSGLHHATLDIVFARTSGEPGDARGITAFLVPTNAPGFEVRYFHWTFNMPTDHAEVRLRGVRVPAERDAARGGRGTHGRPALRAREPHPPGGVRRRRRAILHRRERGLCAGAQDLRRAARHAPGDPVPARRAPHGVRDGARPRLQDGVEPRPPGTISS